MFTGFNLTVDNSLFKDEFERYKKIGEKNFENNKNEKFRTQVHIDIPYEDGEKTIYDGSLTLNKNTNFRFYRYD